MRLGVVVTVDYDDLATEFMLRGYLWKINGQPKAPDREDVKETLDKMREKLYHEPVPSQMTVGRLLMLKLGDDNYEVYLQIGKL